MHMQQRTLRSKLTLSVCVSLGLSSLYTSRVIQGVNMCAHANLSSGTSALSHPLHALHCLFILLKMCN